MTIHFYDSSTPLHADTLHTGYDGIMREVAPVGPTLGNGDVYYHGVTYIMNSAPPESLTGSVFHRDLQIMLVISKSHATPVGRIQLMPISREGVWQRDTICRTSWGMSFIMPGVLEKNIQMPHQLRWLQWRSKGWRHTLQIAAQQPPRSSGFAAMVSQSMNSGTIKAIWNNFERVMCCQPAHLAGGSFIGVHFFKMAGGNILAGRLPRIPTLGQADHIAAVHDGEIITFIGRNSAIQNAQLVTDTDLAAARLIDPVAMDNIPQDTAWLSAYGLDQNNLETLDFIDRYMAAKVLLRVWMGGGREGLSTHTGRRRNLASNPRNVPWIEQTRAMLEGEREAVMDAFALNPGSPQALADSKLAQAKLDAFTERANNVAVDWGGARNNRKVIFIDQWVYHIDLQTAYLGAGIYIVHDFMETDRFLTALLRPGSNERRMLENFIQESCQGRGRDEMLNWYLACIIAFRRNNRVAVKLYQHMVEKVCNTLTRAGYIVVRVAGIMLPTDKHAISHGNIETMRDVNVQLDLVAHCCMNVIACAPGVRNIGAGGSAAGGQRLELCLDLLVPGDSRDPLLKTMWAVIQQKIERSVMDLGWAGLRLGIHFIEAENSQIDPPSMPDFHLVGGEGNGVGVGGSWPSEEPTASSTTTLYMLNTCGGLRCQTMLLSPSDYAAANLAAEPTFLPQLLGWNTANKVRRIPSGRLFYKALPIPSGVIEPADQIEQYTISTSSFESYVTTPQEARSYDVARRSWNIHMTCPTGYLKYKVEMDQGAPVLLVGHKR